MIRVFLDKNLCSRKLKEQCAHDGGADVDLLPGSLRNLLDDELLKEVIPTGRLLVTNDRAIAEENADSMPVVNPGILIVEDDADQNRTMTWRITLSILRQFKTDFTEWRNASWNNSIVRLSPSHITVSHISGNSLAQDAFYHRSQDGWTQNLNELLRRNSQLK